MGLILEEAKMADVRHFSSYSQARESLRALLDSAAAGAITTLDRGASRFIVIAAEDHRNALARLIPSRARVVAEGGGWVVLFPEAPVHGDGETFADAIDDAVEALREYAEDWNDRLRFASNHVDYRSLVELVELSTDEQLKDWILAEESGQISDSAREVSA